MTSTSYLDFDLLVDRSDSSLQATVLNSPAGQAPPTPFNLPFSDQDLELLVLQVFRLTSRGAVRAIGSPGMKDVRAFGGRLFEALFTGPVSTCLLRSMDEAERTGSGLRVRLHLGSTPGISNIPWEFLYDSSTGRFLCLSDETPLVRYVNLAQRVEPLAARPPLRMLCMFASPSQYPPLDLEHEWGKLTDALRDPVEGGRLVLEKVESPTLEALQRRLRRNTYHIFHFVGHGVFDEQRQDGVLLFEDLTGKGHPVSGESLGVLLHDHESLRLVVLNACEGARTSSTDPFAGTAQSLVRNGIPAVIAMQFEITEQAAITLANEFYSSVADGYPVDGALSEARKAIFTRVNAVEWATPVLYMRSDDGRIFEIEDRPAAEEAPAPVLATSQAPAPLLAGSQAPPVEPPAPGPEAFPVEPEPRDPIAARGTAVKPKRRRRWLVPVAILVILGVLGGVVIALSSSGGTPTLAIPNVMGSAVHDAKTVLAQAGFLVQVRQEDSDQPEDVVISTAPTAGTIAKRGSVVVLSVSTGPHVVLPTVQGDADAAQKILQGEGFTVIQTSDYSLRVPKGDVYGTDPPAGTSVKRGATVTLLVSRGAQFYVDEIVVFGRPIAYWRFNEPTGATSAVDQMGQFGGTYHFVQLQQPGALAHNTINKSASFDGMTSSVEIPSITLTGDFTIEFWAKLNTTGSNTDAVLGQGGPGPDLNFYEGKLRLYTGPDDIVASTSATPDQWEYWVITRSGDQLTIYHNGKKDAPPGALADPLSFSSIGFGNAGHLSGDLDELAIYDRALKSGEIREHYGIAGA